MADPIDVKPQYTSMSGCLTRMVWAMFGPAVILVSSLFILVNQSPYGSFPDFVILGGAIAGVVARFLDPGVVDSNQDDGDIGRLSPRKYATWMVIGALIVLVAAHSVAPLLH